MDMSGFDFDFEKYTNYFKSEIEKNTIKNINEYIKSNPGKSHAEITSYITFHTCRMSIDVSINVLREYHLQLTKYLESK